MNVPLSLLICGLKVYCLISIIDLLIGASLLALAKSIYYHFAIDRGLKRLPQYR